MLLITARNTYSETAIEMPCPRCEVRSDVSVPRMLMAISRHDAWRCKDCGYEFTIEFAPLMRNPMIDLGDEFSNWWLINKHVLMQDEGVGVREIASAAWEAGRQSVQRRFAKGHTCRVCGEPIGLTGHLLAAEINGDIAITDAYCAEHWKKLGE